MFGIGGFELFIILIFGFLIFGPDKLPEIAKTVGKGIARFREAQQEMNETIGNEKIFDPNNPDEPFKDPVEVLDKIAKRQEEKQAAKAEAGRTAKAGAGASASAGVAAGAGATAKPAEGGGEQGDVADGQGQAKTESFTERKARYERERAARKAAQAEAAKSAQSGEDGETGAAASGADGIMVANEAPVDSAAPKAADEPRIKVTPSSEGGDA